MLRTILFFVLMYLLVKVISRLFLPSPSSRQQRGGPGFFYTIFDQHDGNSSQQHSNNGSQNRNSNSGDVKNRLDQIEEAEFEEIIDEEPEESKPE